MGVSAPLRCRCWPASGREMWVGCRPPGLLFGDWGTSRLYVLGLAFFFAGRGSFYLICRDEPADSGGGLGPTRKSAGSIPTGAGVYTAAKSRSRMLAVVGALLLFADYVVTASLSSLDAFRYFSLPHGHGPAGVEFPGTVGNRFDRRHRDVQPDGPETHRRIRHRRGDRDGLHHPADHLWLFAPKCRGRPCPRSWRGYTKGANNCGSTLCRSCWRCPASRRSPISPA